MIGFAAWLQATPAARALSEGWLYAGVNVLHVLGIALLFGAVVVLDLRLLGVWRAVPLAALAAPTERVAGVGAAMALLSGAALFAAQATDYIDNPFFYAKLAAVAAGLLNVAVLHASGALARGRESAGLTLAGGVSLASWLAAITFGRLIAYW